MFAWRDIPLLLAVTMLAATPAAGLNEGLQCVPYARAVSGIAIYGDAHTWWGQAKDAYKRGNIPRVGAVLAFIPYGKMKLGHVASVSAIVDSRTILISHANWSTIGGVRGHIETNVKAIDVSANNDWSRVRIWYSPLAQLGATEWPVYGFIYPRITRNMREQKQAVTALLASQRADSKHGAVIQPVVASGAGQTIKDEFELSKTVLAYIDRKAAKETTH